MLQEIKYYQKLAMQLPTIIFLPMYEVGALTVKEEIQSRIKSLLSIVFKKFEQNLV